MCAAAFNVHRHPDIDKIEEANLHLHTPPNRAPQQPAIQGAHVYFLIAVMGLLGAYAIYQNLSMKFRAAGIELNVQAYDQSMSTARKNVNQTAPDKPLSGADASKQITESSQKTLPVAKILWVDDKPLDNFNQRLALAALGIYTDAYTNNIDGLEAAKLAKYDVVISDVHRVNQPTDGADLWTAVRALPGYANTPFIFYSANGLPQVANLTAQPHTSGTNIPDELNRRVLDSLRK